MKGVAQTATRICSWKFATLRQSINVTFNQGNCQSSIPCTFSLLFDIFFAAVAFAVCHKSISFQIYLAQDVERGLLCGTAQGGGDGVRRADRRAQGSQQHKVNKNGSKGSKGSKRRKVCNAMSSVSHKYEQ